MRVLDLFSGIGGFSIGLERAGMKTVAFCEIEPFCRKVLQKHWPGVPIYPDIKKLCRRIYDCEPEDGEGNVWCPRCDQEFGDCECVGTDEFIGTNGQPDIITGGFPCQDISFNGEGAGITGRRSGLWFEMLRVVNELEPRWVIVENVAALNQRGLSVILKGLSESGYDAEWHTIPASFVGAGHKRERLWIIAYSKSLGIQGLWPEGFKITYPLDKPFLPLRDSNGQWKIEPDLRRIIHGVPNVSHRLKALGNAVVPQIPELIGRVIMAVEGGKQL